MGRLIRGPMGLAVLALFALLVLVSTIAIVPETQQAVILRLERPYRTVNAYHPGEQFGHTQAGPILRLPFIDRIVWVDKRVQNVALDAKQPVLSTDQLRLEVGAYARYRVVDPLKMVVTAGSADGLTRQLQPLLGSAVRDELGKRPFAALLSPERGQEMRNITKALQVQASQYGVEIVDVRINHADLPSGSPLDSALASMASARAQEAATIRAQGFKQAQIIQANAEAQAAQIYAASFNKDPAFYDFYRAMNSYLYTFGANGKVDGDTQIILSPNDSYLRQFMGQR